MNSKAKAVRTILEQLSPSQSIPFVKSFMLSKGEETAILMVECRSRDKLSMLQLSDKIHCSPRTVIRIRQTAFTKIYKALYENTLS